MTSEREKMLSGQLYNGMAPGLVKARERAKTLLRRHGRAANPAARQGLIKKLFGRVGTNPIIEAPFYCDYGSNITAGDRVYMNAHCVILDCANVTLGSDVFFAPYVQIYTATHPLDHKVRRSGLEFAKPITIGSDVWIGGGAIVLPGVTIGDRTVIGAGSVVTKNIPSDVVAVGNPCRVIRRLAKGK